ncbi:hypothetical protein AAG570_012063 [Ranatra chinensis]|uniref:PLD phosphodiesterase domain-containing protein n=1 Tax=Ranatra chinensis TaxID=642074 RepID=A0ABD0YW72_9HEMI
MLRTDHDDFGDRYNEMWGQKGWFKPSCVPITIILVLIVLVVLLPLLDAAEKRSALHSAFQSALCNQNCSFRLVESIPENMSYKNNTINNPSTFDVWSDMISSAHKTIEIASFYWTLRNSDVVTTYPGMKQGEAVFNALLDAGKNRGISIKIAQSQPSQTSPNIDTEILAKKGAAKVRSVNMLKLVGGGVLHTKLWIIDRSLVYVGSANTDWRSLTQVKEMGLFISNCSCLVHDISKIFDVIYTVLQVYWSMGLENAEIPDKWPDSLATQFNAITPLITNVNYNPAAVYVSSSPPQFCPLGRTTDIGSILDVIQKADHFIYIAVMDYIPMMIYSSKPTFWPVIDNALRAMAIDHRVEVRLLISSWNHTRRDEIFFLKSLENLSGLKGVRVKVKLFVVPSDEEEKKIPFARVNHNKYMVTDNIAYVGTSNWSGDYFTNTAGLGVIIEGNSDIRDQLEAVFLRDWNSEFAFPLPS